MSSGGVAFGGLKMVITPEIVTTVIFLVKTFGSMIVFLLTVICVLGGVIWKDLRKEIQLIKEESTKAIKDLKEDGQVKCSICSSRNKDDHNSIIKECEELWDAVETCCPRGK